MKLAFCLFKYFPFGGLQRDFLRIAQACYERGHQIHVYTMHWEGESDPAFQVRLIQAHGWQNHTRAQSFVNKVKLFLDREQYDLVIGFNKMPYLDIYYAADVCYAARMSKQRKWLHRLLPRYRQLIAFEKAVFLKGSKTKIMLLSPYQQKEFNSYYQTEPARYNSLPPGIMKNHLTPSQADTIRQTVRHSRQLSDTQFLLLLVGSGFKTKGLDRAIIGLAMLPAWLKERCQLVIIGQDYETPFIQLARRLQVNDKVHFLGGRSDVFHFLLAADLLLHPAYHENTGAVLLEALAFGLPVLTINLCGYAHYITQARAGIVLSTPFQQTDFNRALEKMLLSSEYPAWRQNALVFAKQANWYDLVEKAVAFIEQTGQKHEVISAS